MFLIEFKRFRAGLVVVCLEQSSDPSFATRSRPSSAAGQLSAAEEIKWSDMPRILIGKLLGSTGEWVLNYNDMVPLWVVNRINSIRM